MAHDVAHAIVQRVKSLCEDSLLHVEIALCSDDHTLQEEHGKSYVHFRKVLLEIHPDIGTFKFGITSDKCVVYNGFTFTDFEDALKLLLYQHVFQYQFIDDVTSKELIVINTGFEENTLSLCYRINLSEIPENELDTITTEIIERVHEPLMTVYAAWKKRIAKCT